MNWADFTRPRVSRIPVLPLVFVTLTWRYSDAALFVALWFALDLIEVFAKAAFSGVTL